MEANFFWRKYLYPWRKMLFILGVSYLPHVYPGSPPPQSPSAESSFLLETGAIAHAGF